MFQGIGKVLEIYTNYNHNNKCVDFKQGDDYGNLDASGWDYQVKYKLAIGESRAE